MVKYTTVQMNMTLPILFLFWLLMMLTFLLGLGIGWMKSSPGSVEEIKKLVKGKNPVGSVKRPTAEQLEKRENKLLVETEQAMEETLKEIL